MVGKRNNELEEWEEFVQSGMKVVDIYNRKERPDFFNTLEWLWQVSQCMVFVNELREIEQ